MFVGTWWSLMPPIIAILLALLTKEVYLSLFAGCALGALLVAEHGQHNRQTGPEVVDHAQLHGLGPVMRQSNRHRQADLIESKQQSADDEVDARDTPQLRARGHTLDQQHKRGADAVEHRRAAQRTQRLGHGAHQAHGTAPAKHGHQTDQGGTANFRRRGSCGSHAKPIKTRAASA